MPNFAKHIARTTVLHWHRILMTVWRPRRPIQRREPAKDIHTRVEEVGLQQEQPIVTVEARSGRAGVLQMKTGLVRLTSKVQTTLLHSPSPQTTFASRDSFALNGAIRRPVAKLHTCEIMLVIIVLICVSRTLCTTCEDALIHFYPISFQSKPADRYSGHISDESSNY
jgi:hypothetical protein